MKKLSFILLILTILIAFVGCSNTSNESVSETAIQTTTTTTERTTTEPTIYNGVPYEGMPESRLNYTKLGAPTSVDLCTDFYKLRPSHRTKYYVWKKNGSTIFKATVRYWDYKTDRAVDGYVSDVTDWTNVTTTKYHYTTKKHTTTTDPYNVNNYSNEDDFYEDHYDDFMDYYEAEDYYDEYHD